MLTLRRSLPWLLMAAAAYGCSRSNLEFGAAASGAGGGVSAGPGAGAGGACVPSPEICNGVDDDCNGAIDEGCGCAEGATQSCGIGACAGVQSCVDGVWTDCKGPSPQPEVCNGVDDNCDGTVDEGCSCTDGAVEACGSSVGACKPGTQVCSGGVWGPCQGGVGPSPEACNGVDDNCNGSIDEGCDCVDGATMACGSNVGACKQGQQTCSGGTWGPCQGGVGPSPETCNGIDDNCDGKIDEGFGIGEPCDGPDSDLCMDDVMTCAGCSAGPDNVEICNGIDDDCDGVIDNGCGGQPCAASVVVTFVSTQPGCFVDTPITGDTGAIDFPCDGGAAMLALGDLSFSGTVIGGQVNLVATTQYLWVDNCVWQSTQHITGSLGSGTLDYSYSEMPISGSFCASACTATGALAVQ